MIRGFAVLVLVVVLLGACAPRFMGMGDPTLDPTFSESTFTTRDGLALPLARWEARRSVQPETVILALHGFNDYSNAFAESGPWLAAEGFTVYAWDQRGFGAGPMPGRWAGQDAMIADVNDAVAHVRTRHPAARVVLLGESMGGALVMAALAGPNPPPVDAAILAAPAVWGHSTMPWYQRTALAIAARLVPGWELSGSGLDIWASDNFEMLRGLGADPLVIKRTRVDTILGLVDLMETAYTAAGDLPIPVLWLYGQRDEIVPVKPTMAAAAHLDRAKGQRFVLYPNGWHMLLRDLQGERVLEDIAAWLKDPEGPLPSGAEAPAGPL
ncbi:MAG: lysophospholipase [Rhodospirillaceae bacterium]